MVDIFFSFFQRNTLHGLKVLDIILAHHSFISHYILTLTPDLEMLIIIYINRIILIVQLQSKKHITEIEY